MEKPHRKCEICGLLTETKEIYDHRAETVYICGPCEDNHPKKADLAFLRDETYYLGALTQKGKETEAVKLNLDVTAWKKALLEEFSRFDEFKDLIGQAREDLDCLFECESFKKAETETHVISPDHQKAAFKDVFLAIAANIDDFVR